MKMKRVAMVVLASMLACGSLTACGDTAKEKVDKTKTQLYVATFEGGYGVGWLQAIKARFEEAYAGVSFESGKTGVQVFIKEDRNLTHQLLVQNLEGSTQEVFFTEAVNYYDLQERGLLYDISDAVTQPLNYDFNSKSTAADEETVSVESKMRESHKEYFKANDGKYYGIPFYEANYGIVYDIDLFEKELLYFAAPGAGDSKGFIRTETSARSAGPDGQTGTSDDGLPATYEDFFKLCDNMVSKKITPITWNGKNPQYMNALVEGLQADYEGEESMRINYTNQGTATLVESINDDGTLELEEVEITPDTGYLTWTKQVGKYYGLQFVERLVENEAYYIKKDVVSPSYEHLDAQNAFITGKFIPGNPTIGMLVDGSWWHNEAKDTFKAAAKKFGEKVASANARRFGFMALPKATEDKVGEDYTIMEVNRSICFVNGNLNPKKDALVKEFLQFCHTNKSLAEFTTSTLTCKPYTYTMTDEELTAMPYWGRELYKMHNEAHFMSTYSKSELYKLNEGAYTEYWNAKMFKTQIKESAYIFNEYNVVTNAIILNDVSAKAYFEGLSAYLTKERWQTEFMPVDQE